MEDSLHFPNKRIVPRRNNQTPVQRRIPPSKVVRAEQLLMTPPGIASTNFLGVNIGEQVVTASLELIQASLVTAGVLRRRWRGIALHSSFSLYPTDFTATMASSRRGIFCLSRIT